MSLKLLNAGNLLLGMLAAAPVIAAGPDMSREFVFSKAPFAQCHASTIAESEGALVVAWFGGAHEKSPDTAIWLARRDSFGWSAPRAIADGSNGNGVREPVWNPVLFQPRTGPLQVFYKVGPDPAHWRGMRMESSDGGRSWTPAQRMPDGILGPSKNKPIELADGSILSPSSSEAEGWQLIIERSDDGGRVWQRLDRLAGDGFAAIQPSLLAWSPQRIQLLARSRQHHIVQSDSMDGGRTWSKLTATVLPNPNSGIDALRLRDGRALVVYNPTRWRRSPLSVALSEDGQHWKEVLTLERGWGEFSYPAVIQSADGLIHITYTWKRERIRHVTLDPAQMVVR